jgi:predicted transcriptional regulator
MTRQNIFQAKQNDVELQFDITNHGNQRKAQRGIKDGWIASVIRFGKVTHKQGLRFYYLTGKQLRQFTPCQQERLKKLVVVAAQDSDTVITVYKNNKAPRNIRLKPKRLIKN